MARKSGGVRPRGSQLSGGRGRAFVLREVCAHRAQSRSYGRTWAGKRFSVVRPVVVVADLPLAVIFRHLLDETQTSEQVRHRTRNIGKDYTLSDRRNHDLRRVDQIQSGPRREGERRSAEAISE
jgi:hypothetical protein